MSQDTTASPDHGQQPTRRSFISRATGTAGLALSAMALAGGSTARASSKKVRGLTAILLQEIMNDEAQHVPILKALLTDSANPLHPKIRPMPKLNIARLRQPDFRTFIETASVFENTGSGLYGGALLNITQTQEYFPTAVGLCTVESRHASWLNSLLGESLVPDFAPVEASITQGIALSRVTEFVEDPRSTFPSFDTTVVTDQNNFFILDFLLFLEYIESAFYAINVPRFAVLE